MSDLLKQARELLDAVTPTSLGHTRRIEPAQWRAFLEVVIPVLEREELVKCLGCGQLFTLINAEEHVCDDEAKERRTLAKAQMAMIRKHFKILARKKEGYYSHDRTEYWIEVQEVPIATT